MKTHTKISVTGLLSGVIALSMLGGCGGGNNNSPSMQSASSINASSLTETVEATTEPPKEYAITNATVFSDGYAWVYLKDVNLRNYRDKENQQTACVNKSGEIQFFLNLEDFDYQSQSIMWSNFQQDYYFWHSSNASFWEWHDGTSLVQDTFGSQKIYDTKGNVVFETDDTYYKVICYADGYYAVMKQVKSIDKNEHYVCFLNPDGTWKSNEWNLNSDSDYEEVSYKGEDLFYCKGKFYDLQSGKVFGETNYVDTKGNFSNGKLLFHDITKIRTIDKQGNISDPLKDVETTSGFNTGSNYAVFFSSKYTQNNEIKRTMYFMNSANNKLSEIVSYTNGIEFTINAPMFDGDKVVVGLKGVDQEYYFTTYSQDGKQLYEPIPCDDYNKIWSACDRILIERGGKYFVYDYNGNLIFDEEKIPFQYVDCHPYSDDVMLIKNSNFNYQYLDNNGKALFEKLKIDNTEYNIVKS